MSKKLAVLFVILSLLFLAGCSSDDPVNDESQSVNLVEPPATFYEDGTTNAFMPFLFQKAYAQNTISNDADDIISGELGNFDIYGITNMVNGYENYGQEKINDIINLDEYTSISLKEFNLYEVNGEAKPDFKETQYDINYSSNLNTPYNQIYDYKYTLKVPEKENIAAILYKDAAGNKINYIERYERDTENEGRSEYNYFQIIHNDNQQQTRFLTYEKNNENFDPVVQLVTINENNNNKEYTMMRFYDDSINSEAEIGKFAAVENLSSNNSTAVFNYLDTKIENSDFHLADYNNLEDKLNLSAKVISKFDGINGGYNFKPLNDFNNDSNYPDQGTVEELYQEINDFKSIDIGEDFALDNLNYNGETLIERIGLI